MTKLSGRYDDRPIKASVVIPVKNGGPLLVDVLTEILAQKTPWPFDILVIDSGSRDGSQAQVKGLNIRLHEIASQAFGHGKSIFEYAPNSNGGRGYLSLTKRILSNGR